MRRAVLSVVQGPDQGLRFEIAEGREVTLGRHADVTGGQKLPSDPYFSRYQLKLSLVSQELWVEDLESRNGTFLNSRLVNRAQVFEGDEIRAGTTLLRVAEEEGTQEVEDPTGQTRHFTSYRILEEVANGRMGLLYRAEDLETSQVVALKVLDLAERRDTAAVAHFRREMSIVSRLRHPHIVSVQAVGVERRRLWIAMDWVEGVNLEERVVAFEERLSSTDVHRIAEQLLRALQWGHDRDIVHRDVKPANVLLEDREEGLHSLLTDFGLAKTLGDPELMLTRTGELKGTLLYMAPEQLADPRQAGPAADLYSVGATLYFALTGTWHLDQSEFGDNIMAAVVEAPLIDLREHRDDIPAALREAIHRCLRRPVRERFQSAATMLEALRGGA